MNKATYMALVERELENIKTIIQAKNNDYTGSNDSAFANFESTPSLAPPFAGVLIRMGDKFKRLETFASKGKLEVVGEGAEDAARDVIGYALILLGMLEDAKKPARGRMSHVDEAIAQTMAFKACHGAAGTLEGHTESIGIVAQTGTIGTIVKQLEEGKYYRNRKGDVMGPMKLSSSDFSDYPFNAFDFKTQTRRHYTVSGQWDKNRKFHDNDLIEEVPKPLTKVVDAAHDNS